MATKSPELAPGRTPPERAALEWVASAVGPGARVRSVRRLGPGGAQATDAVTVDDAVGRRHRLVLQRWIRPGWQTEDVGFDPAKEAAVLVALAQTPIPAPRLVAVDPVGQRAGVPALLTERLPGRPPSAALVARQSTQRTLGELVATIHGVGSAMLQAAPDLRTAIPAYAPFGDLDDAVIPPASRRRDLWHDALTVSATATPAGERTLLHRDVHPANTLWSGNHLTGIVDWTSTSWGPPAADLAHLKVNLVVLIGPRAAAEAARAYEAAGGDVTGSRAHDLRTTFDYLGDAPDAAFVEPVLGRLEAWLEERLAASA